MEDYEDLKKHVNILLVDDDLDYIQVTAFFLKSKGYNVDIATSGAEAINKVSYGDIHIVLLDYYMPELTGEDVVNKIREFNEKIIIILQTGFAGQQPPEETLKRLNIQNYHDKSDGVEKLLLQVTAAVRIFNQQNLIQLSKYRVNAIGKLIKGVVQEFEAPLLSMGASIEASKILVQSIKDSAGEEVYKKMNYAFTNAKLQTERIDKICKTIINQSWDNKQPIGVTVKDICDTIRLMITNELKMSGVILDQNVTINDVTYIYGKIDDIIFIICELLNNIIEVSSSKDKIELGIRENDTAWYIYLSSEKIHFIKKTRIFLIKSIISRIENLRFEEVANQFVLELKK